MATTPGCSMDHCDACDEDVCTLCEENYAFNEDTKCVDEHLICSMEHCIYCPNDQCVKCEIGFDLFFGECVPMPETCEVDVNKAHFQL